jgi:trk system potassium uptake protein TrkA
MRPRSTHRFIDTGTGPGDRFAVIGLGQFGRAVARGLAEAGAEVVAVDNRMAHVEAVKDEVAYAVQFDATDVEALRAHALADMDVVVVAIGADFEACLLATVELIDLGAPRVIARATSRTQRRILESIGVSEILSPEQEMGRHVAKLLTRPDLVNYFDLAGDYDVEEVQVPAEAAGERLVDLNLAERYHLNVITVRRPERDEAADEDKGDDEASERDGTPANGELRTIGVPSGTTTLRDGDTLVVFGTSDDIERFLTDYGSA